MKILVFGTGTYYTRKREYLQQFDILAFIDNDASKQGKFLDGVLIDSPEHIFDYRFDYICILSSYNDEIYNQLISLGVDTSLILGFYNVGALSGKRKSYDSYQDLHKSEIVLCSHLCNYTGGAIALLNMGRIIKNMGYKISVMTIFDGPLRKEWNSIGVAVYEEDYLDARNVELLRILKTKRLVICNTVYLRKLVELLQDQCTPVMWWLHESEGFVACKFQPYKIKNSNCLHVYGVGRKAIEMYQTKFLDNNIKNLLYTVPLKRKVLNKDYKNYITFALIGNVGKTKGHDIFLEAVKLLGDEERRKCSFLIVGAVENQKIKIEFEKSNISQFEFIEALNREEMWNLYGRVDVVVSTSRIDTMPTVIIEGMMQNKACIVSPNTGVADFIEDKKSGILIERLTPDAVRNALSWAIINREKLPSIGREGNKIYHSFFSEEVFVENVSLMLEECIEWGK